MGAARALSALVLSRARGCGPTPELPGGPFTIKTRAGRPRRPPEGGPAPIKTYPPDLSRQPTPKPRSTATARPRVPATRLHPVTCRGVSAQPWGDGTGSPSRSQGPQPRGGRWDVSPSRPMGSYLTTVQEKKPTERCMDTGPRPSRKRGKRWDLRQAAVSRSPLALSRPPAGPPQRPHPSEPPRSTATWPVRRMASDHSPLWKTAREHRPTLPCLL